MSLRIPLHRFRPRENSNIGRLGKAGLSQSQYLFTAVLTLVLLAGPHMPVSTLGSLLPGWSFRSSHLRFTGSRSFAPELGDDCSLRLHNPRRPPVVARLTLR